MKIVSCNSNESNRPYTIFQVQLNPSFSERCTIRFHRDVDSIELEMLMRNNPGVDMTEDTFYYKIVHFSDYNNKQLDSFFERVTRLPNSPSVGMRDGTSVDSWKIVGQDTLTRNSLGASIRLDSIVVPLLKVLQQSFNDSLVSDYLTEVKSYMTVDSTVLRSSIPTLYRMREAKYGW